MHIRAKAVLLYYYVLVDYKVNEVYSCMQLIQNNNNDNKNNKNDNNVDKVDTYAYSSYSNNQYTSTSVIWTGVCAIRQYTYIEVKHVNLCRSTI